MKNKNVFFSIVSILLLTCFMSCKAEVETPVENITISYISEQGLVYNEEESVVAGYKLNAIDLRGLSASGYDFLGWFIKGEKATEGQQLFKDTVLVAKWKKVEDKTVPADVTELNVFPEDTRVQLTWKDPDDKDLFGIEISYTPKVLTRAFIAVEPETIIVAPKTQYAEISKLKNETEYTFTVKAVDLSGNKSNGVSIVSTPKKSELGKVDLQFVLNTENKTLGENEADYGDTVILKATPSDAVIYYTIDGSSNPPVNSKIYTEPFKMTDDITIKAVALKEGMKNSDVISKSYAIKHYSVTFNSEYGTAPQAITGKKKGDKIDKPDDLTADGYKFYGWLCDGENVTWPITVTGDKNLIGQWRIVIPGMTELPEYNGTAGTNWAYVEFGIWPQTKYSGDENALKPCANINSWDNCYTDGNGGYYVKVKAAPYYREGYTNDPTKPETMYTFADGKPVVKDTDYYFKLEPIEWRVLTDNYNGKKLLLAEKALGNCAYFPFRNPNATRIIGDENIVYNNNYKHSEVRAFLNGYDYVNPDNTTNTTHNGKGFLQKAFTPEQIKAIADTEVDNSALSTIDAGNNITQATDYVCGNTTDKIFLLSEKEVTTTGYGFDTYNVKDTTRQRTPTDYAKATGIFVNSTSSTSSFWLRSPHINSYNARFVYPDGNANCNSFVQLEKAVVPALTISF